MALYPQADQLEKFPSRFVLANLAARRAKQIKEGAPVLIETESRHPLTIALEEIAEGAVKPVMVDDEIVPAAADTLDSIDLLAQEATGESVLDVGNFVGRASGGEGEAGLEDLISLEGSLIDEPTAEFADQPVSLEEIAESEKAEEEEELVE